MTNWLIRALGGVPKHDYDMLNAMLEGWRGRAIAAETSVSLFKEIMTRDKEIVAQNAENARALMQNPIPPNMQPVGNTISSWPRIRREMERQHRAKSDGSSVEEKVRSGQQNPV